jgi:hypothetical protein
VQALAASACAGDKKCGRRDEGVVRSILSFHGNEFFIATNNNEAAVSANDAIVELVGVTNIHHATNLFGLVTLHV